MKTERMERKGKKKTRMNARQTIEQLSLWFSCQLFVCTRFLNSSVTRERCPLWHTLFSEKAMPSQITLPLYWCQSIVFNLFKRFQTIYIFVYLVLIEVEIYYELLCFDKVRAWFSIKWKHMNHRRKGYYSGTMKGASNNVRHYFRCQTHSPAFTQVNFRTRKTTKCNNSNYIWQSAKGDRHLKVTLYMGKF